VIESVNPKLLLSHGGLSPWQLADQTESSADELSNDRATKHTDEQPLSQQGEAFKQHILTNRWRVRFLNPQAEGEKLGGKP
jgi:hypothetical protein